MKLTSGPYFTKKRTIAAISGMLLLAACERRDPDCYQSILVLNFAQFQARYTAYDTIRVDSFSYVLDTVQRFKDSIMPTPEMNVIGEDSAYSIIGKEITILKFPFNPEKDSIRYRFRADTTETSYDTLTFFYTPAPHFISNNCGYTYFYTLNGVKSTGHVIDSSYIVNASLTDDNTNKAGKANVVLYFKSNP